MVMTFTKDARSKKNINPQEAHTTKKLSSIASGKPLLS